MAEQSTIIKETRYNQLVLLLDKTLAHSRKSFNMEQAIQECYGHDIQMFDVHASSSEEEDEENVLVSAIHAMMDWVNDKVQKEMLEFFEQEGVEQKLNRIETIIAKLDANDQQQLQAEEDDRQNALLALEAVRLPKNVSPTDVMRYHAYQEKMKHLVALQNQVATEEMTLQKLLERKQKLESILEDGDENLHRVKQTLETSAAAMNDSDMQE